MKDNILITGGLGLLGKSLVSLLSRKNYNVFVLDGDNLRMGINRGLGFSTDDRKEKIDFTTNYTQPDPSSYLAASEGANWSTGVIAAQSNTIQAAYIAETGATLVEFATPEETIAAVRNGEADAVLADDSYLRPIAAEDSGLMFVGDRPLIGGGVGMGIRKSDAELR